jgi:hypothetical protein
VQKTPDLQGFEARNGQNERPTAERAGATKVGTADLRVQDIERFWAKVSRGNPAECWNWKGGANARGYGRFKVGRRLYSPHRIAFELAYGRIVECRDYHGTVVMHLCDNPRCCNPAHLRAGRQIHNVRDMIAKGRKPVQVGTDRYNAKLTPEKVRAIRSDPRSERAIAAEYGISKGTVNRIRLRRAWSHVA